MITKTRFGVMGRLLATRGPMTRVDGDAKESATRIDTELAYCLSINEQKTLSYQDEDSCQDPSVHGAWRFKTQVKEFYRHRTDTPQHDYRI